MKTQMIKYKSSSRYIWAKVTRKLLPNGNLRVILTCPNDSVSDAWTGDDIDLASKIWQKFNLAAREYVLVNDCR